MKSSFLLLLLCSLVLLSCNTNTNREEELSYPIVGTWRLLSATTIEKGKRTDIDYTKNQRMIKIINNTHFAFLKHNLKADSSSKNGFDAGGGRYILKGDNYTEFLDYYVDPNWEGKKFDFKIRIENDTLIQTGIEKVEKAGVDRTITERYLKVKDN